ncbi:O-methyltransferase family 3 [Anaeromyxobacter dehalogenans 2CP-1]|uniref:O-methyltransferase family 3 n=1 Tax=Anaeromyxobacter dehalogenans (strain ATCC BAA-258 / DSM 21875 / 2CP-1) TaxID=455488 RepID=B8J7K8_ANAD2|nr:O-methyltransferase [Anaeromyxobacter dehalogenans]ACL67188.1 O-methyltransferase family 3 [Anaeromyxobacter dehalogenans 2CP-1]
MGSPDVKAFGAADPELAAWAAATYRPEDEVLRGIRERSIAAGLPAIQVGAMDGLHLEVLARACGWRSAVEIGTLGGYSGVCLLRGMGERGRLDTFELDPGRAALARRHFEEAGVADRVRVHVGPALERLAAVEAEGPFDVVFIDADKKGYPAYLDWAAEHLRVGGAVLADNTFGFGQVHRARPQGEDPEAMEALRTFSARLAQGGRFRATLLPTGEGLSLGVKVR